MVILALTGTKVSFQFFFFFILIYGDPCSILYLCPIASWEGPELVQVQKQKGTFKSI